MYNVYVYINYIYKKQKYTLPPKIKYFQTQLRYAFFKTKLTIEYISLTVTKAVFVYTSWQLTKICYK